MAATQGAPIILEILCHSISESNFQLPNFQLNRFSTLQQFLKVPRTPREESGHPGRIMAVLRKLMAQSNNFQDDPKQGILSHWAAAVGCSSLVLQRARYTLKSAKHIHNPVGCQPATYRSLSKQNNKNMHKQ